MKVIDTYNAIVGGIIALLSYVFGEHWILFALFLVFNVFDWITGWMKSRMTKRENSSKGWKGVPKKLGYWMMIVMAIALTKDETGLIVGGTVTLSDNSSVEITVS